MEGSKLSNKLELYGKKVYGISAYANGWLPLILAALLWGIITTDLMALPLYDVAIRAVGLSLAITAAITIRTPDKMAFNFNLSFLGYLALSEIYDISKAFLSVAAATNSAAEAINSATNNNPFIANGVAIGRGMMIGGSVLGGLFWLAVVLFFCIFYIGVFVGHRKFFLTSVKEMQSE